jgi:hypothetical protein
MGAHNELQLSRHDARKNIRRKNRAQSRKIWAQLSLHSHTNSKAQMENAIRCQDMLVAKATTEVSD